MTWEGPFFVNMSGGYIKSLRIIHDCKWIAVLYSLGITKAGPILPLPLYKIVRLI